MSKTNRVKSIVIGLLMLLSGIYIIIYPGNGYKMILWIVSITTFAKGAALLAYYFTMAMHMVGGKRILYRSFVFIDLGLFTAAVANVPELFIMIYLMVGLLFSGVVDILRAREAKHVGGRSWIFSVAHAAVEIGVPVLSIIFIKSMDIMVYAYAVSAIYSGITKIVSAFRNNAAAIIEPENDTDDDEEDYEDDEIWSQKAAVRNNP